MKGNFHQFDWYSFSKLNPQSPNLSTFNKLLQNSDIQNKNVPNSYRKNILLAFQNSSRIMKNDIAIQQSELEKAEFDKRVIREQIKIMKSQLQVSIQTMNAEKLQIQDKKTVYEKLKNKIEAKKNAKMNKQKYFCPLCARDDIGTRQAFTLHMMNQHIEKIKSDNGSVKEQSKGDGMSNEVKELILTLKDKQIQLMQMMLTKKKQMQTQQLQKAYELQLKRLSTPKSFYDRKQDFLSLKNIDYKSQEEDEELYGESQYLFFQQQQRERKRSKEKYSNPTQNSSLKNVQNFNKEEYYNIFNNFSESRQYQKSKQDQFKQSHHHHHHHHHQQRYYPIKNKEEKNKNVHSQEEQIKNLSWHQQQSSFKNKELKNYSKVYNYTQKVDFNKQIENKKYETIYRMKKNNEIDNITKGHIFNSGPLMDDQEYSQSDFQDYFGEDVDNRSEISDQQIILTTATNRVSKVKVLTQDGIIQKNIQSPKIPHLKNLIPISPKNVKNRDISRSYTSSQDGHSNIVLDYSKDPSFQDSNSKDKSDSIHLSSYISKRMLNNSKDYNDQESSINLSDLRYSKLERQRKNREDIKNYKIEQQKNADNTNFVKKNKPEINVLDDFKKQEDIKLYNDFYSVESNQHHKQQQKSQKHNILLIEGGDISKTKPSILDEFIVKYRIDNNQRLHNNLLLSFYIKDLFTSVTFLQILFFPTIELAITFKYRFLTISKHIIILLFLSHRFTFSIITIRKGRMKKHINPSLANFQQYYSISFLLLLFYFFHIPRTIPILKIINPIPLITIIKYDMIESYIWYFYSLSVTFVSNDKIALINIKSETFILWIITQWKCKLMIFT